MSEVAMSFGTPQRTVYNWLARHCDEGMAGLQDRSSAARRYPKALAPARVAPARRLRHAKRAATLITGR